LGWLLPSDRNLSQALAQRDYSGAALADLFFHKNFACSILFHGLLFCQAREELCRTGRRRIPLFLIIPLLLFARCCPALQ
jgi:hypothetical protein